MTAPADLQGLPWPPGEPGPLRAGAGRSNAFASALDGARGRLDGSAQTPGWTGVAQGSFQIDVAYGDMALLGGAQAFRETAATLSRLASVIADAQATVRRAAARLAEARRAAAAAAQHATALRSEADAAQARALASATAQPLLMGPDPLAIAAQNADASATSAEATAAAAAAEEQRVQAQAQAQAQAAIDRVTAADQAAAGTLSGLLPNGAGPGTGTPAAGPGGPGLAGGLSAFGQFLRGDVANFWSGKYGGFPFGSGLAGLSRMYGVGKWSANTFAASAEDGVFARLLAGGDLTALPTFNNGLMGRGAAALLGKLGSGDSALGGASTWLSDASAATPWFRGLGIAGGVVSTGIDAYGLVQDGNPVTAFQRQGAGYVADLAKTGFSASTTAFLIAPNPVTGGAVIVTGAVWLGAEAWQHRAAIEHAVGSAVHWTGQELDHGAQAFANAGGDLAHGGIQAGSDLLNGGQQIGADGLAGARQTTSAAVSGLAHTGSDALAGAGSVSADLLHGNLAAAGNQAVGTVTQVGSDAVRTVTNVGSAGLNTVTTVGGDALGTAGHVANDVLHTGSQVAHDLEPWNWG